MAILKYFPKSFLASFGVIWLFTEAYMAISKNNVDLSFGEYFLLSCLLGVVWFAIDGFFVSGFFKKEIFIDSNAFDTKVIIKFGDLFREDGWKAIPVNDFFDSIVDEKHIASKSLHGYTLQTYWNGDIENWDNQISQELSSTKKKKKNRNTGKKDRYPIGTTAAARQDANNFLFVVLAKTNLKNLEAKASPEDVIIAIKGLLQKAREVCASEPLNIPLMGSGLSRIGIKNNILVDLILTAIFEETKQNKITNEICIILPLEKINEISLHHIQKDWS